MPECLKPPLTPNPHQGVSLEGCHSHGLFTAGFWNWSPARGHLHITHLLHWLHRDLTAQVLHFSILPAMLKNKLDHQNLPWGGWQNKAGKKRTDEAAQPTQPKNTRSLSLQWPKAPWGLQNHPRGSSGDSGCEKDKADSSEAAVCTLPLTLSNISFWMCFLTSWTFCPLNSSTNITCKDGSGDNFFQNLARNRCHRCSNQYKEVAGAAIFDMQKIRVQVLGFFHYVQSSLPKTSLYTCQHPHRWQTAKSQK